MTIFATKSGTRCDFFRIFNILAESVRNICIASPELLANRKILRVNTKTDFRQNEGVFFFQRKLTIDTHNFPTNSMQFAEYCLESTIFLNVVVTQGLQ